VRVIKVVKPGGLENLAFVHCEEPIPGPDEVLVRWHASSLNYHDYLVASGTWPVEDGRCPLSDGAGEVIAIGSDVSEWQAGDRVMTMFFPKWTQGPPSAETMADFAGDTVDGYASELSCVASEAISRIPESYNYLEAATLPCAGLTAWRALKEVCDVQPGDSVLIQGTGSVSLMVLVMAKAMGAHIYCTSSSDVKLDRLRTLDAKEVINYQSNKDWGETVNELSQGGVDHVFDVGGSTTIAQSIQAVKVGGHIALIGGLGGFEAELSLFQVFIKQIKLTGMAVGNRIMQEQMVDFINRNELKPIIDSEFALTDLADAFRYQASGRQFGKIVVKY
jgi:NADPH:quinone reductase-like Zn-dependent oxidoreductase